MMRPRRGLLFVPGSDPRKIRKSTGLGADCVCLDFEDGVASGRLGEARLEVAAALRDLDFGRSERLVRINAVGSGLEEADLAALLDGDSRALPEGIVLPKVSQAEQVRWLGARLGQAEAAQGRAKGSIVIIVLIETALGIVDLSHILSSDRRIQAAIFGAEDLAGDIGMTRSRGAEEFLYARGAVVVHAAAFGLQAIDMVHTDFRDLEGLVAEARQGAAFGFTGKQLIHPAQIGPAQAAFTPSPEAVAKARQVVEAFAAEAAAGRGAFEFEGSMADMPILKAARRLLDRAASMGVGV